MSKINPHRTHWEPKGRRLLSPCQGCFNHEPTKPAARILEAHPRKYDTKVRRLCKKCRSGGSHKVLRKV